MSDLARDSEGRAAGIQSYREGDRRWITIWLDDGIQIRFLQEQSDCIAGEMRRIAEEHLRPGAWRGTPQT